MCGCESPDVDVVAAAAAAAASAASHLPRGTEGPPFDRASTPMHLARGGHRARKRWSVLLADDFLTWLSGGR